VQYYRFYHSFGHFSYLLTELTYWPQFHFRFITLYVLFASHQIFKLHWSRSRYRSRCLMVSYGLMFVHVCCWPHQPSSFRTLLTFVSHSVVRKDLRTFEYLGQLNGEENIGRLAAAVRLERRPASTSLKIVPVDGTKLVTFRGDGNDATWR